MRAAEPFDGGDPHGIVYRPEHIREHASAVLLSKDIADYLERMYPGWMWAIEVDPRGGVINLRSLRLSGEWGYIFKMADVQHEPSQRKRQMLLAAGEVLERFGIKPGRYTYEAWKNCHRDVAGDPRPILTDKSKAIQKRARDEALTRAVANGEVEISYKDIETDQGTRRQILIASGYRSREQ